ncbi:tetratricopeptide repeat protein [Candidatus Poribacteria bacterium]|nr:tetratricopeptide repeat protein [Candidatus Poribacteria bacterium]
MTSDDIHGPKHWKVKTRDGSKLEPASLDVLRQWVASRQIGPNDLVINEDLADWIRASEVIDLFDLFEKQEPKQAPPPPAKEADKPIVIIKEAEAEVEVPDCAYHSGRKATVICVGCGKFICDECRQKLDGKVYCGRCMAEKQAGVEPGAPVGPGVVPQIVLGAPAKPVLIKTSVASVVLAICAVLASAAMFVPGLRLVMAPAASAIAFIAVLLGGFALNRIRLSGEVLRGKRLALTALIAGCIVLVGSFAFALYVTMGVRRSPGGETNVLQALRRPARRAGTTGLSGQAAAEREAGAKQLLEQIQKHLNEGQIEQAVSASRTLIGLYPETQAAGLVEKQLPSLEQALARQRATAEETHRQNEQVAQTRLEHAVKMYSEGDRPVAEDILKSIVDNYPDTKAAEAARAEIARIEQTIADQELGKLEQKAAQLAEQANKRMELEQYAEAAELYRRILNQYPQTPTATSVKPRLAEAEVFASNESEREFRRISKGLENKTYEQAIDLFQSFLMKYSTSSRAEEAKKLLDDNRNNKNIADNLYNFGHTYFEEQKYDLALGRFEKLIKEHPRSRWVSFAKREYDETLRKLKK